MREVDDEVGEHTRNRDAAGGTPHVTGRDVAPPAVVEAEQDEDDELDRDDYEDRVDHQAVVRGGHALVEAEPEREPPRERDQDAVGEQLPDAVAVDRGHETTGPA